MASSMMEEAKLPGGYLVTPRVPQGLAAAVEGLTREVIRNSPEDIYVFAAHHFEKLLQVREECGVVGGGGNSSNIEGRTNKTLMEMSRALRMREIDREHARTTRNAVDQVGWSLNQTAKVLKRHRSIFGDQGRRITTDQVFLMANEKDEDPGKSGKKKLSSKKRGEAKESGGKSNELWKASTSRTEHSLSNEDSRDSVNPNNGERVRAGPKIMTQMSSLSSGNVMLAKDIKTELRKNRISSRDRRTLKARDEDKNAQGKSENKVAKSSSKSWSKKPSEKQKKMEAESADKRSRKNNDSTRSSRARQQEKSRGEDSPKNNEEKLKKSMDRVKDYVIDKFATTRSIEELQSVNYVEKVQEIIDETGPIISEKLEQLKSGVIGRSERSWRFARGARVRGSNEESTSEKSGPREAAAEISGSENSSSDALRTRLTETEKLMEDVSSSLGRSLRRSRSARSLRRSMGNSELPEECSGTRNPLMDRSENSDDVLEARLAKTRDLMEGISSSLSKPMRRSCSAKSLRKREEPPREEEGGSQQDALKRRLDETRNLLRGISASFGKSIEKSTKKMDSQDSTFSEDQSSSKSSLPAVRSMSLRNSSGSVSRSDPDNLVLPAISPEAPKSSKIKENLILPVLSPPGTASTNEDSSTILDTNEDEPLEDFGIPEMPVEDCAPEFPVENLSRDSLNVTPDFDGIPQRPDSLEPSTEPSKLGNDAHRDLETFLSPTNDLAAKTPENEPPRAENLAAVTSDDKDVEKEVRAPNDLEPQPPEVVDLPTDVSGEPDLEEDGKKTPDDVESRLREIQRIQKNVEEALQPKSTITPPRTGASDIVEKLRELEDAEKRIDKIFDVENRVVHGDTEKTDHTPVEIVDSSTGSAEKTGSDPEKGDEVENEKELKVRVAAFENSSDQVGNLSPEVSNYTYVLTEGSPYEIPDTVTTVIIPEQRVESPFSDTLNVEIEDDTDVKLSLIPSEESGKASIEAGEEKYVTEPPNQEVGQETLDSRDENVSEENLENIVETEETRTTAGSGESSPKGLTDAFGELVRPETLAEFSPEIEFIKEIHQGELKIPHQDLGPINEEVSEELEDLPDKQEAMETLRNVEKLEEDEREIALDNEDIDAGKEQEDEVKKTLTMVDESKVVESDLSPEATRPNIDSESSNEAKESSAVDEPLGSGKCENSMDEEVTSATRTPESSNEIKETTLTDALSLSLDPTRPFVPELNLDSLQDITVSSFKITEDDFDELQEREAENTNSITDTLTSGENNRNNGESVEESVPDYLSPSPSGTKSNGVESHESEEIPEEAIVKSQVEIKEDICEKATAYVTGPNEEDKNVEKDEIQRLETEIKTQQDTVELEGDEDKSSKIVAMETAEENLPEEAKQDKVSADPNEPIKAETDHEEKDAHLEDTEKSLREVSEHEDIAGIEKEDVPSEKTEEQEESVSEGSKKVSPRETENLGTSEGTHEEKSSDTVDETSVPDVPEETENTEPVTSEKEEGGGSELQTEITKEPAGALCTPEVSKVDENDDLSSEKEANIKSQDVELKNEDEINVAQESDINDEEKERIDEQLSKEIDSEKFAGIDTTKSEKMESPKTEEIDTEDVEKIVDIIEDSDSSKGNEMSTNSDGEKRQDPRQVVGSENEDDEGIDEQRSKEIDGQELAGINTAKSEKMESPKTEEIDTEDVEKIADIIEDSDSSKENEISTNSDGEKRQDPRQVVGSENEDDEGIDEQRSKVIDSQEFGGIDTTKNGQMESPKTEEIDTEDVEKIADIIEDSDSSKGNEISTNSDGEKRQDPRQVMVSENAIEGLETGGEEAEESFVEEETPLAVSRSASQCTTRRVSSGNLAKLREDPTLGWTEEIEREDEKIENDPSSSKVTFSGVTNEQTTNEKASKENDENVVSPSDVNGQITGGQTTKDKEYHIYVPEVDASEDYSTTESSTFDSAVTKIQAGVRGFLTRRRLLRGLQNRSSTLSGIPSIQDSMAIEPDSVDDQVLEASEKNIPRTEETSISSPKSLDDNLVDAATTIQSNYRRYKARKRLRREDAVQRTTFSLEKSFAESGLQHTGEFHDCIPLPIHDIRVEKKSSDSAKSAIDSKKSETPERTAGNGGIENAATPTLSPREFRAEPSIPFDPAKIFFANSANAPLIQLNVRPNVSQLIDLVVLAKEDAALQTGYLNFITSVEDAEPIIGHAEADPQKLSVEEENCSDSLREPLALSGPPIGLILEEITSSIGESLTKIEEENGQRTQSTNSSQVAEKSSSFPSKVISGSIDGDPAPTDSPNRSELEEHKTENFESTNHSLEYEAKKLEKPIANESESSMMNFPLSMEQSSIKEKEFLGPESSVDSMECPDVKTPKKVTSCSPQSTNQKREECEAERIPSPQRDSPDRSKKSEKKDEEDSMDSNIDDSLPSKLSFSIKVEDLLDLGSEDSIDLQSKKPLLEVTLKPTDLMKSMSLSQESQLAGERIESPITMIQIAPGRSESLRREEHSENGDDQVKENVEKTSSPNSPKIG